MAIPRLLNRTRVSTATTGTGTITLGTVVNGFLTFAEAGINNGDLVYYTIEDGNDFEIGQGTYTSSGTTLSRDTVLVSKVSGTAGTSKLNLSGTAVVFIAAPAESLFPQAFGMRNVGLAASAGSSALTIALKGADGNDPSVTNPVTISFRSATGTTGTPIQYTITSALSLVISSGSTMGVTSSTAFRIWIGIFDDGGTLRLGAANCLLGTPTAVTGIYPLRDDILTSSTAEGGAGAADSAGVIYTGTAVSSKAFRTLGYLEWNTSGLTAGTWTTTNLSKIQVYHAGVPLPGMMLQTGFVQKTDSSSIGIGTWSDISGLSLSITPTSAANVLRMFSSVTGTDNGGQLRNMTAFNYGGNRIGVAAAAGSRTLGGAGGFSMEAGGFNFGSIAFSLLYGVQATGSQTVKVQIINDGTVYINRGATDTDSSAYHRATSCLECMELQA